MTSPKLIEDDVEAHPLIKGGDALQAPCPHRRRWVWLVACGCLLVLMLHLRHTPPPPLGLANTAGVPPQHLARMASDRLSDDLDHASMLLGRFKLLHFAEGTTVEEALQHPDKWPSVLVLAVTGPGAPSRRAFDQPWLSTDEATAAVLPVAALNAATSAVEAVLQRRMFPLFLHAADFGVQRHHAGCHAVPYAVWDVSTGYVVVDAGLVSGSWGMEGVKDVISSLASGIFEQAAPMLKQIAATGAYAGGPSAAALGVLAPAAAAAAATAFGAAPPLWFCVLCPTLLGLLSPLAINFGLGGVAGQICAALKLGDNECFDVMLGAIGLAMVLSLASAIPIFYVCRLMECARHGNGTAVPLPLPGGGPLGGGPGDSDGGIAALFWGPGSWVRFWT